MIVPDPHDKREAVRLALGFPELGMDGEKSWRVGESVELKCVLTTKSGEPLAGARVEVRWGEAGPVQRLTTDQHGESLTAWAGDERGNYQVTVLFPGDRTHAAAMGAEEFYLRGPVPTQLVVIWSKPTEDLPEIWGVGEHVEAELALLDETGLPVEGRTIVAAVEGLGQPVHLVTNAAGRSRTAWAGALPGNFEVVAEFAGDRDYLPSAGRAGFMVVDFREDVVTRYNSFVEWARGSVGSISDQETPREVEAKIIQQGISVDRRALEEVISRFEEADYSTHEIDRPRFEAMFRACRSLMSEETGHES